MKIDNPIWFLSDIGHLVRKEYKNVKELEDYAKEQIEHMEFMKKYREFEKICQDETSAPDKYREQGLKVMQIIRDQGKKSDLQIQNIIKGSACRSDKLLQFLKKVKIITRAQGPNGRYDII
ncbi:MAG TPA: hypothetical protein PLB16_10885 [bacterium]|nr:hypothetical protein [bacterium]